MLTWRFAFVTSSIVTCLVLSQYSKLKKIYKGLTFFNSDSIVDNFRSAPTNWPHSVAHHNPNSIAQFESVHTEIPLPDTFFFRNQTYNLAHWLESRWTTGLVVLKIKSATEAVMLHQSYYLGNTPATKTISWSVGKSVVSALIGIAVAEGKIVSITDNVTVYVPELRHSAYDGVTIKNLLQMSSGVSFDETYDDHFSDINQMCYWLSMGWDLTKFIRRLKRYTEPGTTHNYISVDTQVLGMVLRGAIGESATSYLESKLLKTVGFESDCAWLIDNTDSKTELAFGTLNMRTTDYARFGWLYANQGLSPVTGLPIIDAKWITDSTTAKSAHLMPTAPDNMGYGYQWWLPGNESDPNACGTDYMAIGVYGQFIYVDPVGGIVIAKNSADPNYNKLINPITGENLGELEAVRAFRAITKHYCS